MSSFFRSAADVTDSGEDSNVGSYAGRFENSSTDSDLIQPATNNAVSGALRPTRDSNSYHQNILLHALLEERCINEAAAELKLELSSNDARVDSRIRVRANEKYARLSEQLASHGLVPPGLDASEHGALRQRYRDGLSLLSQNITAGPESIRSVDDAKLLPHSLQRLVSNGLSGVTGSLSNLAITAPPSSRPPILESLLPNHPLLDSTRYTRDFDEFGILGKGGYGTVFHVQHKLDGLPYAVKKIPLGPSHLRRIQRNGQSELDIILVELRTMARLEHPNIVRYYNGWIEWSSPSHHSRPRMLESLQATSGASDDRIKAVYSTLLDTTEEQGIVFEDSASRSSQSATSHNSLLTVTDTGHDLEKMPSRSTLASVDDEEIEFISRDETTADSTSQSTADVPSAMPPEPSLALHIQMSLYPMTLTTYLSPDLVISEAPMTTFRHCFHLHGSIHIMLAIMDGVEYLHGENIVHRDLKPGNIFLAARPCPFRRLPAGTIDPFACSGCRQQGAIAETPMSLNVCIGDFGLVSTIKSEQKVQEHATPSRAVGTELYRPEAIVMADHPSLDVFALGIVFFELLWKFGTRMERHETLHQLRRHAEFPPGFASWVRCRAVEDVIKDMVCTQEQMRPSCQDVRARLVSVLEKQSGG